MEIPLHTDILRSIDPEVRTSQDARNFTEPGGFGEMFAEVRQREVETDDDRDTPPPGTEAALTGQAGSLQARQSSPAQESRSDENPAEPVSKSSIAGANKTPDEGATPTVPAATATSPESFAALLESSANGLSTALTPAATGDAQVLSTLTNQQQMSPATTTPAPTAVTTTLATPVQSSNWPAAFNNTIRVMITEQTQVARLQLTPGDLGPVDVRIAISDHRAEIAFAVSSPEAKAAIQQALPQLRETFAASGLQLGDATFGESRRDGTSDPANRGNSWPKGDPSPGVAATPLPTAQSVGLIDLYA